MLRHRQAIGAHGIRQDRLRPEDAGEETVFVRTENSFRRVPVPAGQKWFDGVLQETGKSATSELSATDILQDFVRSLWIESLKRMRGALPASGDVEADMKRMKISMDLKRLARARWHDVKEIITNYMKGEN